MAITLEVTVKKEIEGVGIHVVCGEVGVVSDAEAAYMAGLMEAVEAYNTSLDKPTQGCNCAACRRNRKKQHEYSNLH